MNRLVVFVTLLGVCYGTAVPDKVGSRRMKPLFPDGKIIGGQATDITQVPWTLLLEWDEFEVGICGASIIGAKWAVTAAQCCEGFSADELRVRTGSSDPFDGTLINVTRIISHEKYNSDLVDYDIALLELAEEITFGPGSQTINLTDTEPATGDSILISGWAEDDRPLRSVTIPVADREICKVTYDDYFAEITDRMFCAGEVGKGFGRGDIGGPAVSNDKLVGIVSWTLGSASEDVPQVYTNIVNTEIRDWIKTKCGI